jgi:hypothetical protein
MVLNKKILNKYSPSGDMPKNPTEPNIISPLFSKDHGNMNDLRNLKF